ncbi:MAG: alpha/beta hydrolase, partial [Solirubrobacterales bacterium]
RGRASRGSRPLPEREELGFEVGGDELSAWRLRGEGDEFAAPDGRPCVVMATGMGGTKDSGLLPFGEAFAAAGLDALLFDYRGFGTSGGEPRQDAWPPKHREDLRAAVAFARGLDGVDPDRIVLWGWSWGAGHSLFVASESPEGIAAMIALTPVPDAVATMRHLQKQIGAGGLARLTAAGTRDQIARARGLPPVTIPLVGPPGSLAAFGTDESEPGYTALAGPSWRNEVCARVALGPWLNHGMGRAARVRCPILVQTGDVDTIAHPDIGPNLVWKAKGRAELREYPGGHFDLFLDDRGRVIEHQLHFLRRRLSARRAETVGALT